MFRLFLALFFVCVCSISVIASPLDDAIALWHLSDLSDTSGNDSVLKSVGDVEFVTLSGREAVESKLRGGDGKAVKISKGGYLSAEQGSKGILNIQGQKITIALRLQVATGHWDCPVFAKHGGHTKLSYNIYSSKERIGCEFGTTENKNLLSATVPFSELYPIGEGDKTWHDVICRIDGAKLEMFVDGRCVDEEFLLGELRTNEEPVLIGAESYGEKIKTGFEGLIDHIAVWNRSLSNSEIVTLSGGQEKIDKRERTDRGIPGESMQYWRPPNNYFVGDCLPFYDNKTGTFHFAYLLDKGHHTAKNGYGAHQWIQATSTDLIHWKHQPFLVAVTDQWEGSICTGSVFMYDHIFYAFYATRAVPDKKTPDGKTYPPGEYVGYATSTDGIHFTKQNPNPLIVLPREEGYSAAGRDPVVFQDEWDGIFHMYITANFRQKGCWAHLTSKDLKNWELQSPVLSGGGDPECPDWFKWGDTYYLIVNWGNGYYRTSKTPIGPWEKPSGPDILMAGVPRVPKTAAFTNGRRIITGWTNENGFGGHAVFHELFRNPDGMLYEKFVLEMKPQTLPPVVSEKEISCDEKIFERLPENYRLTLTLEFDPVKIDSPGDCSIIFYEDASKKEKIHLNSHQKTVQLGNYKIEQVDFSSGKIRLEMYVKNGIVDLCINDCRTITATIPQIPARKLVVEKRAVDYHLRSIEIAPLQ